MTCGDKCKCDCCKKKKERAKKAKATKKLKASAPIAKHRMVNINVNPPVGEGAPKWKKDLVSVDTIGEKVKPIKQYKEMATQTENIIKEELKAPRPAKYIRQPITVSAREPTMAVVEPPSRYARQMAQIVPRIRNGEEPLTRRPRPRGIEIETQTEEAPEGTRVTRQFEVVPENRGRPTGSGIDSNQRLITDLFRRG